MDNTPRRVGKKNMSLASCGTIDEKQAETMWNFLRSSFQTMLETNNQVVHSGEELYRNVFKLVLHKHGERLYTGLKEVITGHLEKQVRKDVLKCPDDTFLQKLSQSWNDYQNSMKLINDICTYVNRVHVAQNELDDVYTLGLILFRDRVILHDEIRDHLRKTLLDMVILERNGGGIDHSAVKNACQMLIVLGIDSRHVYEEIFENPLLAELTSNYRTESQILLAENNASVHIKKVENLIMEESERAKLYLDKDTESRCMMVAINELIRIHMKAIVEMENSGVVHMVKNTKTEDLACLCRLFSHLNDDDSLKMIATPISEYFREQGKRLITASENGDLNPVAFVQNLLDLKDHFNHFLVEAFNNNEIFKNMVSSDFECYSNLINKHMKTTVETENGGVIKDS